MAKLSPADARSKSALIKQEHRTEEKRVSKWPADSRRGGCAPQLPPGGPALPPRGDSQLPTPEEEAAGVPGLPPVNREVQARGHGQ